MAKTDKNFEREIIRELTRVCEDAKFYREGFIWLDARRSTAFSAKFKGDTGF